jgi:hypothetical protein
LRRRASRRDVLEIDSFNAREVFAKLLELGGISSPTKIMAINVKLDRRPFQQARRYNGDWDTEELLSAALGTCNRKPQPRFGHRLALPSFPPCHFSSAQILRNCVASKSPMVSAADAPNPDI